MQVILNDTSILFVVSRFIPRTSESDYVMIDPVNYSMSCRSTVGRKGGKQVVRAGNCKVNGTFNFGPILHELFHVIGLSLLSFSRYNIL